MARTTWLSSVVHPDGNLLKSGGSQVSRVIRYRPYLQKAHYFIVVGFSFLKGVS